MYQALQLQLLGELDIQPDGAIPPRFGRKAISLLCYLAVEQGRHPVDQLLTLFWDGDAGKRNRLDSELTYVRKLLPPGTLPTVNGVVQWQVPPEAVTIDVQEFAKLARSDQVGAWKTAVRLYRGNFWADCVVNGNGPEFERWLSAQRERWRDALITLLERIILQSEMTPDVVSAHLHDLLQHDPTHELANRLRIRWLVKNGRLHAALSHYRQYARHLEAELDLPPTRDMQRLYTRTLAAREQEPKPVPRPLLSLIGRTQERKQIRQQLLQPDCQLLTVVGPAGIGKTRLVQEIAADVAHAFLDGVCFLDVTAVSPQQLPYVIADALHISLRGAQQPEAHLFRQMQHDERLLILDSFENQLPAGRNFVYRMLTAVAHMKCLITSRQRLNLRSEWLFPLQGLTVPAEEDQSPGDAAAVQLFLQRACQSDPTFAPTAAEQESINQICRLTAGMPLAIELAAYWVKEYSATTILQMLQENLALLQRTGVDAPERHWSIPAAFDYSWRHLAPEEQQTFAQLCIFPAKISLSAATFVTQAERRQLANLVDKSMVMQVAENEYRLHPLVRQYGLARLNAWPQLAAQARARLIDHCVDFLQARNLAQPTDQQKHVQEIGAEMETILAAWETAVQAEAYEQLLPLLHGVWAYHEFEGLFAAGYEWIDKSIKNLWAIEPETPQLQLVIATLHARSAWLMFRLGRFVAGRAEAEAALRILSPLQFDDAQVENGRSLAILGLNNWYLGQYQQARSSLLAALKISRQYQDPLGWGQGALFLGFVQFATGAFAEAEKQFQEILEWALTILDYRSIITTRTRLSNLCVATGREEEAQKYLDDAYEALKNIGDPFGTIICLLSHAKLALCLSHLDESRRLTTRALALSNKVGEQWHQVDCRLHLGAIAVADRSFVAARDHYLAALQQATEMSTAPQMLAACAGLLQVEWTENGRLSATSYALLQKIGQHPALHAFIRQTLAPLNDAAPVTGEPPSQVVTAVQQKVADALAILARSDAAKTKSPDSI